MAAAELIAARVDGLGLAALGGSSLGPIGGLAAAGLVVLGAHGLLGLWRRSRSPGKR